jgi:hypothetical protein
MRIEIDHTLTLSPLPGTQHLLMHLLLTPGSGPTQTVESWSVEVAGIGNAGRFSDAYGNMVHLVNQSRPEGDIVLSARGVVVTRETNGVVGRPGGEPVPALYRRVTTLTRAENGLLDGLDVDANRIDLLHALMARAGGDKSDQQQTQMQADGAQVQSQGVESPDAQALTHRFISAARALDIPARYVCGYLVDEGLHCWAEAYDEGLGWIGFDPVLQLCATERHVRLAVGLDAETAVSLRAVPMGEVAQNAVVRAS